MGKAKRNGNKKIDRKAHNENIQERQFDAAAAMQQLFLNGMRSTHDILKDDMILQSGVALKDSAKQRAKICCGCAKVDPFFSSSNFMRCTGCKAVFYCSKKCQKLDWTGKQVGKTPTKPRKHKDLCKELCEAKEEFRTNQDAGEAIRRDVFGSWANQHDEESGVFNLHLFLARKKLLGQDEVGFWATPDVNTPWASGKDCKGFQNGRMLLEKSFPSMKKGWKELKADEYPSSPPTCPPDQGGLKCWREYFEYRHIATTSISPLILTNVLTIYQMIYHELKLQEKSKNLHVFVLGAETELNQIPLFGELAYLMPGIDLELTFVSPATKAICDEASSIPTSLIHQDKTVLHVQAPAQCGNGRVRVHLNSEVEYFNHPEGFHKVPDAVVGLNAGLATYPQWYGTMYMMLTYKIPFSFSECAKLSLRYAEVIWLQSLVENFPRNCPHLPPVAYPKVATTLNPFHGVINRDTAAVIVPNISNGYLFTCSNY